MHCWPGCGFLAASEPGNRGTVVVPQEGQTMRCKVLYDYDAEDETELTIKEGKLEK